MSFLSHKLLGTFVLLACTYSAAYAGIRLIQPWCINSNDGPGLVYRSVFFPLRFADAARPQWYWLCIRHGGWITGKVIWNNLGNGYLTFETPLGLYRAASGWDLRGAKQGEVVRLRCGFNVETWDDFSNHLVPSIEDVDRTPNQSTDPTP